MDETPETVPSRKRNPRVVAVEALRRIKSRAADVSAGFQLAGKTTVFVDRSERPDPNMYLRPRLPHEYAEARIEYWLWLREEIRKISADLIELETLAMEQINRIKAEQPRLPDRSRVRLGPRR